MNIYDDSMDQIEIEADPITDNRESASESLAERLSSEMWKTRFDALVELTLELSSAENVDIVQSYIPLLLRCLSDPQPWVQEKVLDSLLIIISRHSSAIIPSLDGVVSSILENCLTSEKAIIKDKGMEAFMNSAKNSSMKIPLCKILISKLAKYKAPKIIVGVIQVLEQFMLKYNKAIFKLQDCIEEVNRYGANSTNASIRDEVMEFYRIASRVFGKEIIQYIKELKPAQQEELRKICEESVEVESEVVETNKEGEIKRFDEKWCEYIISLSNWNDKCEGLEELIKTLSNQLNETNVVPEVIKTLQILIEDNNMSVAEHALKAVSILVNVIKEDSSGYYKLILKPTISRLKDIKTADEALRCLEAISSFIKFEENFDAIKEALIHPSTTLRVNICHWLEHFLILENSKSTLQSQLIPMLVKLLDEPISYLREKAITCLAIIYLSQSDPNIPEIMNNL